MNGDPQRVKIEDSGGMGCFLILFLMFIMFVALGLVRISNILEDILEAMP